MNQNTKVKCDVESCKHNSEKLCCLDVLAISCTCDGSHCSSKDKTICSSFIEK